MCQTAWRSPYISLTAMQQHQVEGHFRAAVLVVALVVMSQTAPVLSVSTGCCHCHGDSSGSNSSPEFRFEAQGAARL